MTDNKNLVEKQIIAAIKYFKSDFPPMFQEWKQLFKGHTQFQKHFNTVDYTLNSQRYSSLKGKIFDQLLIKLRHIAKNQSYLQNFDVFLLQKLLRLLVRELSTMYKLDVIYSRKPIVNQVEVKKEIQQRYIIFIDCLTSILRYCFVVNLANNKKEPSSGKDMKFTNQMILKSSQNSKEQIKSKAFVGFVLQLMRQKLDQIFRHTIFPPMKLYPESFSVLSEGFVSFRGGSKVLQSIGAIMNQLISSNAENIWDWSKGEKNSMSEVERLGKDVMMVMSQKKLSKEGNQQVSKDERPTGNGKDKGSFSQISRERLLLFIQRLSQQVGYSEMNDSNIDHQAFAYTQLSQSTTRRTKLAAFINQLLSTVEKACFDIIFQEQSFEGEYSFNLRGKLTKVDENIVFSLVVLAIDFQDQHQRQSSNIEKRRPCRSQILNLLLLHVTSHPIICSIQTRLQQIFISKFKLLTNKNKTISSAKTLLLKQISKLSKFINFQQMSHDSFQTSLCLQLKDLFRPNQTQLNRPMIIALNDKGSLSGQINSQAIPLTDLEPHHSFVSYPVGLSALNQSIRFQESRQVLDEVKLFGWFEHEEVNLREFKSMIANMHVESRLQLLEFFTNRLLQRKLEQTTALYSLEMSLTQFYQLLVNYFYIDTILNPQAENGFLSLKAYQKKQQLYDRSIIPKLHSLYSLIKSNGDIKRLLVSSKQQELLVFYHLRIFYTLSRFFLQLESGQSANGQPPKINSNHKLKILYQKSIIAEHLILNLSQSTYLLKLIVTSCLLEFSAPLTLNQTLKPLESTLIHRNAGSSLHNKVCNLQFMKNLIQVSVLSSKSAQELAQIYLSKSFITNPQANTVISLIFRHLPPQTMRKCILSIKNWPMIFSLTKNIELLNNRPILPGAKQELFHANDGDNVTVSNALGVIALELNEKWTAELDFSNPRKQILIDAMVNLIKVNEKLIFWKRFFFEEVLVKLSSIMKEIENSITGEHPKGASNVKAPLQKGRRHLLYERIQSKILSLVSLIPAQNYKYSTQINSKIRGNLQVLKQLVEREYNHLKRQCFVYQRYEQSLEKYKQANAILEKIDAGLKYKEQDIRLQHESATQ